MINVIIEFTQIAEKMSFESVVAGYIAIFGILITLISISTVLTKEIRQKLLVKYFIKDHWLLGYFLFYFACLIAVFFGFFFSYALEKEVRFVLFILTFGATIGFTVYFILHLNRKHFYSLLLREIESSLKENNGKKLMEAIDDFVGSVNYVKVNNALFDEEVEALEKFIDMDIEHQKTPYLGVSYFLMKIKPFDQHIFDLFLDALYNLLGKANNIEKRILYQDILNTVIIRVFSTINKFNSAINNSGLHIRQFSDIRTLQVFEKTKSESEISAFGKLRENTINDLYKLAYFIINLDIAERIKKNYLLTQLSELNRAMEHLDNYEITRFCEKYYDYKFSSVNEQEVELAENKMKIVSNLNELLQKKRENLFFLILYKIEKDELEKTFFEIAMKIYYSGDFRDRFLKMQKSKTFDDISFVGYNDFEGGVQSIPSFNYVRYKLLVLLYEYQKNKTAIDRFNNLEKEHFNESAMPLEKEIKKIDRNFVNKYFDIDEKKLSEYETKLTNLLKERLKKLKKDEDKYLSESLAKKEYIDKFEEDVRKIWVDNQKKLGEFIDIRPTRETEKMLSFGQYRLFPKEWFLESFYKNIALSRDAGGEFGLGQVRGKNGAIIEKFLEKLSIKDRRKISRQKFSQQLSNLLEAGKTYYLAYGLNELKTYTIDGLNWKRHDYIEAELTLNDSIIRFLTLHPKNRILLFEEKAIILNQSQYGFKDKREDLFIDIDNTFTKDEISKLTESKSGRKMTKEDIQKTVKIRIAEKFNIEKNEDKKAYEIVLI